MTFEFLVTLFLVTLFLVRICRLMNYSSTSVGGFSELGVDQAKLNLSTHQDRSGESNLSRFSETSFPQTESDPVNLFQV
jgi:hypothetical protein